MYHLSLGKSKKIQQKLQAELLDALPPISLYNLGGPSERNEHQFTAGILSKILLLPYLDAVLKETLRVYTAIPITLPRVVPPLNDALSTPRLKSQTPTCSKNDGRYLEGYFLPAGTIVGSFAYGIHRDKDVFAVPYMPDRTQHPRVDEYYPERWLAGEGRDISESPTEYKKQEEERIRRMEQRSWAFGSGGRGCVGKQYVPSPPLPRYISERSTLNRSEQQSDLLDCINAYE